MNKYFTTKDFEQAKRDGRKITMLTAYDYSTAKIIDEAGVDCILVGDSLGMVVLGYEDTTKVTVEDMIHHTKAVVRGTKHAMVISDLPFASYHTGVNDCVRNAARLVSEGGCKAVKLEGGEDFKDEIKAIKRAGIPIMGHLGYTPQSINIFGGHRVQGKSIDSARKLIKDALSIQEAGVFSVVLECIPMKLAALISEKLSIPTIGIGSGPDCDGQVLVIHDAVGLCRDFSPKHAKRYSNAGDIIEQSAKDYINEVSTKAFPTESNSFKIDDEVIDILRREF